MVVTVLWHCRVVKSQLSSLILIVAYLALPSIIYHRWLVVGWVEPSPRPDAEGKLHYSLVSQYVASVFGCWHAMGNTAAACLGAPSIYAARIYIYNYIEVYIYNCLILFVWFWYTPEISRVESPCLITWHCHWMPLVYFTLSISVLHHRESVKDMRSSN